MLASPVVLLTERLGADGSVVARSRSVLLIKAHCHRWLCCKSPVVLLPEGQGSNRLCCARR